MYEKKERKILAEGPGTFYIKWVSDKDKEEKVLRSKKSGERMIKICCCVTDSLNQTEDIYRYFVENWPVFIHELFESAGLSGEPLRLFENPMMLKNKMGKCKITVKNSIEWGDQNELKFLKASKSEELSQHNPANDFNDSIPF